MLIIVLDLTQFKSVLLSLHLYFLLLTFEENVLILPLSVEQVWLDNYFSFFQQDEFAFRGSITVQITAIQKLLKTDIG